MTAGFLRLWLCAAVIALLMAASFAAGVNSDSASGDEEAVKSRKINMSERRRLLGVRLNDYGEPSANQGHDPRGKGRNPPKKRNA